MNLFLVGIFIGTIVVLTGLGFWIAFFIKNKSMNKMIKKIGETAEISINRDIKVWAKYTNNKFIPSSLFKYDENKVFEVDSILITDKALIVIEIKSIKGGIEGISSEIKWEKVLGDNRHYITNPVIQNDKHIEHIIKMTKIKVPTISLIIYSNRAKYLEIKNIPSHVVIIRQADLFDTLDEINSSLPSVVNEDAIKSIFKNIKLFKTIKKDNINLHKKITNQKGRKKWK